MEGFCSPSCALLPLLQSVASQDQWQRAMWLSIHTEFSAVADVAATALTLSSNDRVNYKGALTVAPPLASEAVMSMNDSDLVTAPVNDTDPEVIFVPI